MERWNKEMKMLKSLNKKVIYWGGGTICKLCLEQHPEVDPIFLIDAYSVNKTLFGKPVKSPNEVIDWKLYYIIITIESNKIIKEIEKKLESKGLEKGQDFCSYKEFFLCDIPSIKESIDLVHKYVDRYLESPPIMLIIPVLSIRNTKTFIGFISKYIRKRTHQSCLMFTNLKVMSSEMLSEKLGCHVFCLPDFVNEDRDYNIDSLSKDEYDWIRQLEERKISIDKEKSFSISVERYIYYKTIIEMIHPLKMIIWGNWSRESYILGYLADNYDIPHGYMEHGCIPGTYQVDPRGVMGQSEYAVNPEMFEKIEVESIYNIKKIKEYIIEKKLDTRLFMETEEDKSALRKIQNEKKKIFLVGMDDFGIEINPYSDYWKSYVSKVVTSTIHALSILIDICKKNNWELIFKPHPSNVLPDMNRYKNNIILVQNMAVDQLILIADVIVSIASAVDYKTLIYGKPLVQLGLNGLIGKGCSYVVNDILDLEEQMKLALKDGMTDIQKAKFDKMVQILLQRYLWDDMSERTLRYGLTVEKDFIDG